MKEPKRYDCGNGEGMFDDKKGDWISYEEHKEIVNKLLCLTDVSQQRELLNALADNFNESTHTYVGQPMIEETLKAL